MPDTTSRVPVTPQPQQPQPQPHYDYPQYPPPPGVRPDLAFVPVAHTPRVTKRRWHAVAVAAAASAAIAATVTALISAQIVRTDDATGHNPAPAVTITATPDAPAPRAPLPTVQADRQTCNAWLAAGDKIHAASGVLAVIPRGTTLVDPAVRDNPDWSAAVRRAADLYEQASKTLSEGVAPGTTTVLDRAAATAAAALRTVSTADLTMDAIDGNAFDAWKESADTVNVLCDRLAPK